MSVTISVELSSGRLPTPAEWAQAIRDHGFAMELPADFEPLEHTGFLPAKYQGRDAGFEYYAEKRGWLSRLRGRDLVISFLTGADLDQAVSSMIAAGVLCAVADGILDEESAWKISPAEAIAWARKCEQALLPDIEKELRRAERRRSKS